MTRPREVLPGRLYLLSRRCSERRFFLRPGAFTNQAVWYCLIEAALHFDIDLYGFIALSNHHHAIIGDRHGHYPAFIERFHGLLARCMNAHWGRWESLFAASEQTSVVELLDAQAVFGKLIYVLCNAVISQLVEKAHHWPGATSLAYNLTGRTLSVERPAWFFRKDGNMPEVVSYTFKLPPPFAHLSQEAWADMLRAAIAAEEAKAARVRAESGTRIVGRGAVRRQSAFDSPNTHAPRRELSPRIASPNKWARVEALARKKDWLAAYRSVLLRVRDGLRDVVFPAGTWKMHVQCGFARAPT